MRYLTFIILGLSIGCFTEETKEEKQKVNHLPNKQDSLLMDFASGAFALNDLDLLENNISTETKILKPAQTIQLPLDSTSFNFSLGLNYFEQHNTPYFVNFDRTVNAINIYDLDKQKLEKKVFCEKRNISHRQMYVRNFDSIYIFSRYKDRIYLLDSSGTVKDQYDISYRMGEQVVPSMSAPFIIWNDLFISGYYTYNPELSDSRGLKDSVTAFFYNLKTGAENTGGVIFPPILTDSALAMQDRMHVVCRTKPNEFITVFDKLPFIFKSEIVSDTTLKTSIHILKSKYYQPYIDYLKPDEWGDIPRDQLGGKDEIEGRNSTVLYDKYRSVYYLVYAHGVPLMNEQTGLKNDFDDEEVSIVIADSNFNYMGETLLEKHKYFRNYIVTKDGLLVSNANEKNPKSNDSTLSFTLFKLVKANE